MLGAVDPGFDGPGQGQTVRVVGVLHGRHLARGQALLPGVIAQRIEHPVARAVRATPHLQQRPPNQAVQQVAGDRQAVQRQRRRPADRGRHGRPGPLGRRRPRGHLGGRLGGEAAREHRHPPKQHLLGFGQAAAAPADGAAHRGVPPGRPALVGKVQRLVEPLFKLVERERAQLRRGQLKRQRDALQPTTDGGGLGRVVRPELERRIGLVRPFGKQPQRIVVQQVLRPLFRSKVRRLGQGQRGGLPDQLGRQLERLTAGGQHRQRRAFAQDQLDQPHAGVQHLLAVVEHDQHALHTDVPHQLGRQRGVGRFLDPQHVGQGLEHTLAVVQRRQVDPPHAGVVAVGHLGGGLDGQPRLAAATRAEQRQQPGAGQPFLDRVELVLAANEAGGRLRQVAQAGRTGACRLATQVLGECLRLSAGRLRQLLGQRLLTHGVLVQRGLALALRPQAGHQVLMGRFVGAVQLQGAAGHRRGPGVLTRAAMLQHQTVQQPAHVGAQTLARRGQPGLVAAGQQVTAVQRQRSQPVRGRPRLALSERGLELQRVDTGAEGVGPQGQRAAVTRVERSLAQHLAQLGQRDAQRAPGGIG